jgi:transcriptional regulator with XRE-family HTH domain
VLVRFGVHVRKLRTSQGWSQEEFAARCGLHRTYIGSIERGEQNISLANIEKVARALGVSIQDLFS